MMYSMSSATTWRGCEFQRILVGLKLSVRLGILDPKGSGLDGSTRRVRILYTNPGKTESVTHVALYARVSTDRQDHDQQIRELEEFVGEEYLGRVANSFRLCSPASKTSAE